MLQNFVDYQKRKSVPLLKHGKNDVNFDVYFARASHREENVFDRRGATPGEIDVKFFNVDSLESLRLDRKKLINR